MFSKSLRLYWKSFKCSMTKKYWIRNIYDSAGHWSNKLICYIDHVNSFCFELHYKVEALSVVLDFWTSPFYMLSQCYLPHLSSVRISLSWSGVLFNVLFSSYWVHFNFQSFVVLELLTDHPPSHQFCLECITMHHLQYM